MGDPSQSTELARVVAEEVTPEVSRFVGTVVGSPSIEIGELIAEEIRAWRFKREIKHLKKAMHHLADAGMTAHSVPLRTLAPLLEAASLEDDESMVDRWASLLANAAGGDRDVPPSFPSVLREVEPAEARILDHTYETLLAIAPELRANLGILKRALVPMAAVPEDRLEFHIENLIRLRLVRGAGQFLGDASGTDMIALTEFGRAFVRACRPPSEPDPPIRFSDPSILESAQRNREHWTSGSGPPIGSPLPGPPSS
jgi:hypothetical protein